jgi:hypothetical protein
MAIVKDKIFIVGTTMGKIDASFNQGGQGDGFISRFNADGTAIETIQFGTQESDQAR